MNREESESEEERWIAGCSLGERDAQRKIFAGLFPYLKGAVRRYIFDEDEIEDVLQEAFIRIFQSLNQFDSQKGSLRAWAARIAINVAITQGKKRKRNQELPGQKDLDLGPSVIESMALNDLIAILKCMPSDQYEVLSLHIIDGYSHKEISKILEINEELSRQRLTRARKWVMKRFKLSGGELVPLIQTLQ